MVAETRRGSETRSRSDRLRDREGTAAMRILGLAGVVLALAVVGYLIVGYLGEAGKTRDALQVLPGSAPSTPGDVTRRGLERRLAPILDQERQRIEATSKAAGQ